MAPVFRFITAAAVTLVHLCWVSAAIIQEVDPHGDIVDDVGSGGVSSKLPMKPFSVQELLRVMAPVEALDINAALAMLEPATATPDDPVALARANVNPGGVPLMHYLMGLLPRLESNGAARAGLAAVITRLAVVGADVNAEHPNPRDPSLLYKVVFMRELDLAQAFLAAGAREQPQRDPDSILGKLASVPCDLVPMAKLLLHADAFLADPKYANQERFQGAAGKAAFLASASRGAGAKPIPRSDYLFNASATYRSLVGQLGGSMSGSESGSESGGNDIDDDETATMSRVEVGAKVPQTSPSLGPDGIPLSALVNSLGEGSAAVLTAWLRAAPTKGKALHRLADAVGRVDHSLGDQRNPLHALAAAGSAAPVDALASFLEERAAPSPATVAAPTASPGGGEGDDGETTPAAGTAESTTAAADSIENVSDSSQTAAAEKKRTASLEKRAALKSRARSAVASALAAPDARGHTPVDVAALRWSARATFALTASEADNSTSSRASATDAASTSGGSSPSSASTEDGTASENTASPLAAFTSPVEVALQRLAVAAGLGRNDLGFSTSPRILYPTKPAAPSAQGSTGTGSGVGRSSSDSNGGGWDVAQWPPLATEEKALPSKCDVLELKWAEEWASAEAKAHAAPDERATGGGGAGESGRISSSSSSTSASAVFGRRFLDDFLHRGQPVVLRGAAPPSTQEAFAKDHFLARYGHFPVGVGAIPYASSFGSAQRVATLGDVANANSSSASVLSASSKTRPPVEAASAGGGSSSNQNNNHKNDYDPDQDRAVEYAFTTPPDGPAGWAHLVSEDAPPPPWLQWVLAQFPHAGYETQFYLGPAGSGAPAHFHGHAVNVLAHGTKRWTLWPPQHALYSKEPAADRSRRLRGHATSTEKGAIGEIAEVSQPLECTQEAGDVLFVPTLWGHATLNERQAIGTAYELSLEPFCME